MAEVRGHEGNEPGQVQGQGQNQGQVQMQVQGQVQDQGHGSELERAHGQEHEQVQGRERGQGQEPERVVTVAHRGAAGYAPENTMAAFRLALDMNADMVELDVQLSKDGELVVIHDDTVDRTTDGTGRVADLTLAELRKLDAGCRFQEGGRFVGEAIPLLTEVLELCRGKAGVLIELKWPELHQGLEQALAKQLQVSGMCGPEHHIIVQSFDAESVKRFRSLLPEIPVGLLVEDESELTAEKLAETAGFADYVNPYLGFASKSLVEAVHAAGLSIFCWTVRTREAVQPLLDAGVDGIITDNPDYIAES